MPPVAKPKRIRQPHFLREWRNYRSYTLEQAAEMINMSRENLGRIETAKVPYNQDVLELLAEAYNCEPGDLLMRNPLDSDAIWSIWNHAKPADRAKIVDVARVLVGGSDQALGTAELKQNDIQVQEQSQRKSASRRNSTKR